MPAAWFLLDQLAHLGVLVVAWAVFLRAASPLAGGWTGTRSGLLASADRRAGRRGGAGLRRDRDLVIVNVRAGSLFVDILVRAPRPARARRDARGLPRPRVSDPPSASSSGCSSAPWCWPARPRHRGRGAAKTLARFKQLDDRDFAEYYLLGTLASVTFAVVTSLLALQALPH